MPRIALFLTLTGLIACESEIDNKTAATVSDAPAVAPAPDAGDGPTADGTPVASSAGTLPLKADSKIEWVGAKVTNDHPGGFETLSGEATIEGGVLKAATVEIGIDSLYSDHPKLTKHLKNADFFDVLTYPTATFAITEVTPGEGGLSTVTGTLDLHGIKKEISFPATVAVTDTSATISAEFTLLRKDFGMAYPGKPDDLIRNEVLVKGTLGYGS
ncbi:MAG: YceI family protein [Myxococcota bacterium]|nr:YceI family protein [Myxococcota bacterium]MEC8424248.1 YceI family protein [Myxococcota bacterium]